MRNLEKIGTVIIAVIFLAFIISRASQPNQKPKQPASICPNCNVIIVGYDTVGASHVSSIGYSRLTTPAFDAIAKEGFLFTQNIAPAPWTVPSFMSLFTDLYPTEHKVVNKYSIFTKDQQVLSNLQKLSPNVETLTQVFKSNGYVTGGFTGDAGVSGQFGYKAGFDVYTDEKTFGGIENSGQHALSWLKENQNKKFFMFLHGYDAHGQFDLPQADKLFVPKDYTGPYTGSPKEEATLRENQLIQKINLTSADVAFWNGLYDSKIREGDDSFAKFWDEFKKMGLDKNTIVVILSDHGEEFYEHGGIDHGHTLYDELIHVPLAIKVPGMSGNKVVNDQVTNLDVAPTLFDILGINPGQQYQSQERGKSLLSKMTGKNDTPQDVFLETDYRGFTHKRGIRTADDAKYIKTMESGKEELYNLKTDPGEQNNLIDKNPEMARVLAKKVDDHIRSMGDNPQKEWAIACLPVYPEECK